MAIAVTDRSFTRTNGALVGPRSVYVNSAGNDTWNGTQSRPWKTLQPLIARLGVLLTRLSAGSSLQVHFTDTSAASFDIYGFGGYSLDAATSALAAATIDFIGDYESVIAGPYTVTAFGTNTLTMGGGLTVNAYQTYAIRMNTGTSAGARATIAKNSANVFTLVDDRGINGSVAVNDTFSVVAPVATLNFIGSAHDVNGVLRYTNLGFTGAPTFDACRDVRFIGVRSTSGVALVAINGTQITCGGVTAAPSPFTGNQFGWGLGGAASLQARSGARVSGQMCADLIQSGVIGATGDLRPALIQLTSGIVVTAALASLGSQFVATRGGGAGREILFTGASVATGAAVNAAFRGQAFIDGAVFACPQHGLRANAEGYIRVSGISGYVAGASTGGAGFYGCYAVGGGVISHGARPAIVGGVAGADIYIDGAVYANANAIYAGIGGLQSLVGTGAAVTNSGP